MKKRIYGYMIVLTLACLIAYAAFSTLYMYSLTRDTVIRDVKEKADLLTAITGDEPGEIARVPQLNTANVDIRVTLISPDGRVLFDNFAAPAEMENHAAREEFREAERIGVGESTRYSSTQGTYIYYYAQSLPDRSVLRLSKTIASVRGVLLDALPILVLLLLFVFVLGNVLANRLTRSILRPIREMDPERDTAVYDELSPLVRTIEHQKESMALQRQDLNRRVALIHSITSSMREGLVLLDDGGVILMANPSAQTLFGASTDMVGRNLVELVRNMEILESAKAALTGTRRDFRLPLSGRVFQVFCSPSPDRGAMLIFVDVTEQAMAEKVRAEFSANVSHELKTPLTSIYASAQMMHAGTVKQEDTQRFAGIIEAEAFRLTQLIEDILKLSKLDESVTVTERESVDLTEVAEAVIQSLDSKARALQITVAVAGHAPMVQANRAMMHELLFNLTDNAIKYNRPSGSVRVEILEKGGAVLIEVSDTGIGIPQEDTQRVFERFYRVDKSHSRKVEGTGLGLAIAKHIALIHGGTIDVWSREGQGTKVTVAIPLL